MEYRKSTKKGRGDVCSGERIGNAHNCKKEERRAKGGKEKEQRKVKERKKGEEKTRERRKERKKEREK